MSDTDIEIILSSDSDYEELTAEIIYKGKFVALLSQDDGIEKCKVEFPSADCEDSLVHRKLDLIPIPTNMPMAIQTPIEPGVPRVTADPRVVTTRRQVMETPTPVMRKTRTQPSH